jgi:TfoX/Sxy family transcriptional regulator of competence genes
VAYDEHLAKRLDVLASKRKDIHQQKMFGGVGYLLRGNMCFGIWKDSLILRLGDDQARAALKRKHVKPFDITGRLMKGWVMVEPLGMRTSAALKLWIDQAIDFVISLPRK